MDIEWQDALMRLGAATASGMAIGINRDLTHKPIGMRTLALVALGAAAVTVASIQFSFMDNHPDALSRVVQGVIQGIMAGISFIGAGVILRDPKAGEVTGLTTAATVWVTAALGIACGLGAWVIVAATLALALFVLAGLAGLDAWLSRKAAREPGRRRLPGRGEGALNVSGRAEIRSKRCNASSICRLSSRRGPFRSQVHFCISSFCRSRSVLRSSTATISSPTSTGWAK